MKYLQVFLLFILSSTCYAQKLTYEVVLFGKVIGTTTVYRNQGKDGEIRYMLQGSSSAKVLFVNRQSSQNYLVIYRNHLLTSVQATNMVDDDITEIKIDWNGREYAVRKNRNSKVIKEMITASTLTIYFKEPDISHKYFSERLAEFYSIVRNPDGTYQYVLSDNIRTVFYYKDGWLNVMEMKKNFVTVTLRLIRVEEA